jgi:hypothetical protein
MKIKIDWKGVPEALQNQIKAVVSAAESDAELSAAFAPRKLTTLTLKFSDAPGGLSEANGYFSLARATLTMQSKLVLTDNGLVIGEAGKAFFETFVHEMLHGAYPHLTDGSNIHRLDFNASDSSHLVGEFVFRSLVVKYTEKIFGDGSAAFERNALANVIRELQASETFKNAMDWENLTSQDIIGQLRDKSSPLSKLLPELAQKMGYYDATPEARDVLYGATSALAYVPDGAVVLDYKIGKGGVPTKVTYQRSDGAIVDAFTTKLANGKTIKVKEVISLSPDSPGGAGATIRMEVKYDAKGRETSGISSTSSTRRMSSSWRPSATS